MFKVGDKVVCVDNECSLLNLGEIYTVGKVNESYIYLTEITLDGGYYKFRFKLASDIDPLVEILQSEYDGLIEEINLLQELLAEANTKLVDCLLDKMEDISIRIKTLNESIPEPTVFKPIDEYTMEDWEQARDEKWVFELNDGTEVFVKGIMDEFDDKDHPIELSLVTNNLHKCTVTERGHFWSHSPNHQRSIKRRIKQGE